MIAIEDIQDALDRPKGRRAFHPALLKDFPEVNKGEFIKRTQYLHYSIGGFAVIYRLRLSSRREIALRCLRDNPQMDAAERSNELDIYLSTVQTSRRYFVHQRYYPIALLVGSEYQPIFVMDWVNGRTLAEAIKAFVYQKDCNRIRQIADQIRQMVIEMQVDQIAHGDLQHDNILMTATGELRLVDYDSVYVPSLKGRKCPVLGMKGYGHPDYLSHKMIRPFDDNMDTFSSLVLIVSLLALSLDPSLYTRYSQDNLLFREEDLLDPYHSDIFQQISALGDYDLNIMASKLQAACLDRDRTEIHLVELLGGNRPHRKPPGSRITIPSLPIRPPKWQSRRLVLSSASVAPEEDR